MTNEHRIGVAKLRALGIHTTADPDKYGDPRESRYHTLVAIVGETAADWIMNDLAISTMRLPDRKRVR